GAQVGEIPNAEISVVMLIVAHKLWVEPKTILHHVDNKVRIARAAHWHNAIVGASGTPAIRFHDFAKAREALIPIKLVLFFVDTAAAAYPVLIKCEVQRVRFCIEAACTSADHFSTTPVRKPAHQSRSHRSAAGARAGQNYCGCIRNLYRAERRNRPAGATI